MTAQHLRQTYAELVNCDRLTKNHKLNLRKICAKLTQNLWPHKCCHNSVIRGNYAILLTLDRFHYSLIIRKAQNRSIKPITHLKVFCQNIFERTFRCGLYTPLHACAKFLLSKVSFTNNTKTSSYFYSKSFHTHTIRWCVTSQKHGRSFMTTKCVILV